MHEIELKFVIPTHKVNAVKSQTQVKTAKHHTLNAYYFDTPDQLLGNAGIALRIRRENGNWVQTIKAKGDGIAKRIEENIPLNLPKRVAQSKLKPDLTKHSKAIEKLLASVLPLDKLLKKLTIKFATKVNRITREIKRYGNMVEVAFDEGNVISGRKSAPICEVEFELLQGDVSFLIETAQAWVKRHGLWYSTVSKAEAGSRLFANIKTGKVVKSNLTDFHNAISSTKNINAEAFLRLVVQNCLQHILPNVSDIAASRLDSTDAAQNAWLDGHHVHQARVGIRRLRTALKYFATLIHDAETQEKIKHWQDQLKTTFTHLGTYRDLEVLQTKTQPMLAAQGAPHVSWDLIVNVEPSTAVQDKAFQLVLLDMIAFASSKPSASHDGSIKRVLTPMLDKLFNKVAKDRTRFAELTNKKQHDVRKQLKALRYMSEFAAPVFNSKKINPTTFIEHLEPAQDVLGEFNDAVVAHAAYLERTKTEPQAWFAVGYFTVNERASAKACSHALKNVKHAPTFWK